MSDFTILKRYEFAHLAHLDRAKLADEEIESFLQDDNIVSINPVLTNAVGGVKLFVRRDDAERAATILHENNYPALAETLQNELDPQNLCPKCSSADVARQRSFVSAVLFLILFFVPVASWTNRYRCSSCGHQWKA